MYKIYNDDNIKVMKNLYDEGKKFNLAYCDMMYENLDFLWVDYTIPLLDKNSVIIVQTDWHSAAEMKCYLDSKGLIKINWCIFVNDWGGTPRKGFPNKHDDILIYANGDDWKWNKGPIQIPKVTAGTKFDKKGTGLKTPPDVFYDHASFSTLAKERIKLNGHNVEYQKPQWLMERLILPFTEEGDWVLDNFMGSGSTIECCLKHNRNVIGIEYDPIKYDLAEKRICEYLESK